MRAVVLPCLFLAATGCSAVVGSTTEAADAQLATSVTGVVLVERTAAADDLAHLHAMGEASARFVRLRGAIDDGALRLVGASLDLPAVGQCAVRRDQASSRAVELLDVGTVSLEAATGQHVSLGSRQVPDVVDLVSGTMYSARIDEVLIPSSSDVAVLVGGSADVPAFSVRAKTPEVPAGVRVSALDPSTVELVWSPSTVGTDAIYVDVGATRCSFADEGHGVVSSSDAEASIAVHRVRREKLSIPGLDGGELRFDFARTVTFKR